MPRDKDLRFREMTEVWLLRCRLSVLNSDLKMLVSYEIVTFASLKLRSHTMACDRELLNFRRNLIFSLLIYIIPYPKGSEKFMGVI